MKKDNDKQESDEVLLGEFIDPKTDFGFHKVFSNPDMLISFLNAVLPEEKQNGKITSVSYLPVEHFGDSEDDRHVIFDTHCKTSEGEDIVIEMQNARPMNFGNRLIFYSTYPIREQAPKRKRKGKNDKEEPGQWYYDLKAVYTVAIVNFPMRSDTMIDWIKLMSVRTKQCFSNIVNFIIVDLTKFDRAETELKTLRDYWLYTIKHAETLKERPVTIRNELFIDLYDILRINKLTSNEMKAYNSSVIKMEDVGLFTTYSKLEGIEIGKNEGIKIGKNEGIKIGKNEGIKIGKNEGIKIGKNEGIKIGRNEGIEITKTQIVISADDRGISVEDIAGFTDLSVEQVRNILANRK